MNTDVKTERLSHSRWIQSHRLLRGLASLHVLVLFIAASVSANAANTTPILISQLNSTRAIAFDDVTFLPEPFRLNSQIAWTSDQRTRVMLFALNLSLKPGDDLSVVTADAEDGLNRHYSLRVESVAAVPGQEWMTSVILRLSDDLTEVGDLLVSVSYHGQASNRVRIGIGRLGGGLPDDDGALPTPAPPYTISGQIKDGSKVLSGITVTLSGGETATTLTDSSGRYSFSVSKIDDYVISPQTNAYYTFTPQSVSFVHQSKTVNFAGTLRYYTVSGRAQFGPNYASFIAIPLSGSQTQETTTNETGDYSFLLPAGGNYVITPTYLYWYFVPSSQIITDLSSDQTHRDFVGAHQELTLGGTLEDLQGNPIPGISISLSFSVFVWTTTTDSDGRYQFSGLYAGDSYTVTPLSTPTFFFSPKTVPVLEHNELVDFTGLRHVTVSGKIFDQSGSVIVGAHVSLTGTQEATTLSSTNGYSFDVLETGSFNIRPTVGQSWYNFSPESQDLTNVLSSKQVNFTGTLTSIPDPQSVIEFDGSPKTIDYGVFWQPDIDLGHFFWEFWAMPGANADTTYLLSDGYGGAHALLFGFGNVSESEQGHYQLQGNIFNGVRHDNYYGSDQGPASGEWGHFAVGWDGRSIITYFDGVPVGKTAFAGPRRTPGPAGGGGHLYIGGSDHNNLDGRIAQVRGFEDANPREAAGNSVETSFTPQTIFLRDGSLLSYFFRPGLDVADLSFGYGGIGHAGNAFGWSGILPPRYVIDPTAPNFVTAAAPLPVQVPAQSPVPSGALVYDSFSRANSTYILGGAGGLGITEGGSSGTSAWHETETAGRKSFGILNGLGVLLANSPAIAWIDTRSTTGNLDVRVERHPGRFFQSGYDTGLSFRFIDSDNYFFAYTRENGNVANSRLLSVGYYAGGVRQDLVTDVQMPLNWTTLRVVTLSDGMIQVFADSTLQYSVSIGLDSSATKAGLFNNSGNMALANRWDNFAVFEITNNHSNGAK